MRLSPASTCCRASTAYSTTWRWTKREAAPARHASVPDARNRVSARPCSTMAPPTARGSNRLSLGLSDLVRLGFFNVSDRFGLGLIGPCAVDRFGLDFFGAA